MSLFRVSGTDAAGNSFQTRFDASSDQHISSFLSAEGCESIQVRRAPLTIGPFGRLPWLMFVAPLFLLILLQCIVSLARELSGASNRGMGAIAILLAVAALMAFLIYNAVMRFGRIYTHAEGIREYTLGDSLTLASDLAEEENADKMEEEREP